MGVSDLEESVVRSVLDALAVAYYTSIELYPACTIVSSQLATLGQEALSISVLQGSLVLV